MTSKVHPNCRHKDLHWYRSHRGGYGLEIWSILNRAQQDITDYNFWMTVSSEENPEDSTTQIFQITGAIVTAASGRVLFRPTEEEADNVGDYWYDIVMEDGNNIPWVIQKGRLIMEQNIRKDDISS